MTAPPDETGTDWTGYPRRKPNPIVHLIRWAWRLFLACVVLWVVVVLAMWLLDGALWIAPFVAFFAFAVFVLFRNRWRREIDERFGR